MKEEEESWQQYHKMNQITNNKTDEQVHKKAIEERISTLAYCGGGVLITAIPFSSKIKKHLQPQQFGNLPRKS